MYVKLLGSLSISIFSQKIFNYQANYCRCTIFDRIGFEPLNDVMFVLLFRCKDARRSAIFVVRAADRRYKAEKGCLKQPRYPFHVMGCILLTGIFFSSEERDVAALIKRPRVTSAVHGVQ